MIDRLTGRRKKVAHQNKEEEKAFDVIAKATRHKMIQGQIKDRRQLQIAMSSIFRQNKEEIDELRQDVAALLSVDRGTRRDDAKEHIDETEARDRKQGQQREAKKQDQKKSRGMRRGRGFSRRPGNDNEPSGDEPA